MTNGGGRSLAVINSFSELLTGQYSNLKCCLQAALRAWPKIFYKGRSSALEQHLTYASQHTASAAPTTTMLKYFAQVKVQEIAFSIFPVEDKQFLSSLLYCCVIVSILF